MSFAVLLLRPPPSRSVSQSQLPHTERRETQTDRQTPRETDQVHPGKHLLGSLTRRSVLPASHVHSRSLSHLENISWPFLI
ncbi:hypothetical protein GN956_G17030 [Arapaima gigas]